jgi:hypothetical protein
MRTVHLAPAALLLAAICFAARPVSAAEITDVADAADTVMVGEVEHDDPFDFYFTTDFTMVVQNGKITREPINRPGVASANCTDAANARDCLPVDELRYKRNTNIFNFGGDIGLFQDVALNIGFHYVIADSQKLRFAKDVSVATSSVDSDRFGRYFAARDGFEAKHSGFGPLDLGLKFGPLSDERDDSKPAWVIYINWANPWMAKRYDPKVRATSSNPGTVGDGVHRVTFGTSLSKRVGNFGLIGIDPNENRRGYVDPYMDFSYTLPKAQKGKALPDNITTNSFGRLPSHQARFSAGMEVVGLEDLKAKRKVSVDLGLCTAFFSEGRNPTLTLPPMGGICAGQTGEYSMLVDALGEDTYTEQFFHVGGILGLYIQAAEFIRFKAGVGFGYDTQHFLTFEEVGKDMNGDGQVLDPSIDPKTPKDRLNPYFCGNDANDRCRTQNLPSYDQVGFRFLDEEHVVFNWFASLMFTF